MADPTLPSEEELAELERMLEAIKSGGESSMLFTIEEGEKLVAAARAVRSTQEKLRKARRQRNEAVAEAAVLRNESNRLRAEFEKHRAVVEAAKEPLAVLERSVPEGSAHYVAVPSSTVRALVHALASAGNEPKVRCLNCNLERHVYSEGSRCRGSDSRVHDWGNEPKRAGGESEPATECACGRPATRRCCGQPVCDDCEHNSGTTAPHRIEPAAEEPAPKQGEALRVGLPINGPYADVPLWPIVDWSVPETVAYATSEAAAKRICNAPAGVPVERVEALRDECKRAWDNACYMRPSALYVTLRDLVDEFKTAKPDAGRGG